MTDNFDRTPGAGRNRVKLNSPGLVEQESGRLPEAGEGESKGSVFIQHEPLRQPRTSPPLTENNSLSGSGDSRRAVKAPQTATVLKAQSPSTLAINSTLSVNAPEFYPSNYTTYQAATYEDDSECGYPPDSTLAELVQDYLNHLNSSPGSFELEIEGLTTMLDAWVTTEETLKELVELIYVQSTSVPNFAYTGARLCNHLSHHLAVNTPSGNFRNLLLARCHTEFKQRDTAVKGDEVTQKRFHSYILFLGELYLNLELKGPTTRATVLLMALKDLMDALFSNPVDGNLICAVKLLKLTGSILEDAWKEGGLSHMDDLIKRIKNIVVDVNCSRHVKVMLMGLVDLRSSNWGRVYGAAAASEATPDNDPNYFMNEPTFYTADGTPFTAADPEYSEKYQEILDREDYFPEAYEENGNDEYYDDEDEMDPEIEEAFEKFCLESEQKRKQ